LLAHAQVNWEGNIDDRGDVDPTHDSPRLIEGWVRKEWDLDDHGGSLSVGVTNPTNSLEHVGPAWTPRYTITPSALNTWLWEEGRVLGFEGEWWGRIHGDWEVSSFAGAGWGPDQQGILLAQRGWVLSDWLAGINSTLVLPAPGAETHEFDELDGRPALYTGFQIRDPWKIGRLRLGYYDNLSDLAVSRVWETRYGVAGVAVEPLPGLEVIFQYLIGKTMTRTNHFDSTIQALFRWSPTAGASIASRRGTTTSASRTTTVNRPTRASAAKRSPSPTSSSSGCAIAWRSSTSSSTATEDPDPIRRTTDGS
jgi:hypothetical protein